MALEKYVLVNKTTESADYLVDGEEFIFVRNVKSQSLVEGTDFLNHLHVPLLVALDLVFQHLEDIRSL